MRLEPNAVAIQLYVPLGNAEWIPNRKVEQLLEDQFSGFTRWQAAGGWRNPRTGAWESEPVWVYRIVTKTFNVHVMSIMAKYIATLLGQQEMLFECHETFVCEVSP